MNINTTKEAAQTILQLAALGAQAQVQQMNLILEGFQSAISAAADVEESSDDVSAE